MCVIAYLPEGTGISRDEFNSCWEVNSHGGGMMYFLPSTGIGIFKSLRDKEQLWREYLRVMDMGAADIVMHFRIATHGGVNLENCHPFTLPDRPEGTVAYCHNGILHGFGTKDKSDTREFGDLILGSLPEYFWTNADVDRLLESYINSEHSKLAIMAPDGYVTIYNADAGQYDEGRWFSNTSYRAYKYKKERKKWFSRSEGIGDCPKKCGRRVFTTDQLNNGCYYCSKAAEAHNSTATSAI